MQKAASDGRLFIGHMVKNNVTVNVPAIPLGLQLTFRVLPHSPSPAHNSTKPHAHRQPEHPHR